MVRPSFNATWGGEKVEDEEVAVAEVTSLLRVEDGDVGNDTPLVGQVAAHAVVDALLRVDVLEDRGGLPVAVAHVVRVAEAFGFFEDIAVEEIGIAVVVAAEEFVEVECWHAHGVDVLATEVELVGLLHVREHDLI